MIQTNDENSNYDKDDRINKLDIPNGSKEMLIDHQFTIDRLNDISPEDLSATLGIDTSVARIIIDAVFFHSQLELTRFNYI